MCEEDLAAWRQKAKSMSVTHPAIVDMVFNNSSTGPPLRVNLTKPITGPDSPALNTNVTYSVPASLPTGVTFNGWTVTPSTHAITGGTNNRTLTVSFATGGTYTVAANFTLPGNVAYSATKTVDLSPPAPAVPYFAVDTSNEQPGGFVLFTVSNPQSGVTYEWDIVQGEEMYNSGSWLRVYCPEEPFDVPSYKGYLIVRCRALRNGVYSAWSQSHFEYLDYFYPIMAPAPTGAQIDSLVASRRPVADRDSSEIPRLNLQ